MQAHKTTIYAHKTTIYAMLLCSNLAVIMLLSCPIMLHFLHQKCFSDLLKDIIL